MDKLFLGLIIFFCGWMVVPNVSAQNNVYEGETLFTLVEKMPEFPGGEPALAEFLQRNMIYPEQGKKEGIGGKVYVRFYVTKTGELVNVAILKGIREDFDNEVIRVIKLMPKWIPGEQNGEAVHVIFNLPIVFKLK